jgi:hypothetical protein
MKLSFLLISLTILIGGVACNKTKDDTNCTVAVIAKSAPPCTNWGITVNGTTYMADAIPAEYQVVDMKVCVKYEIVATPPICLCCGGDIKIISISRY